MKLCGLSPGPWLKWSHHLIIFAESFLLILVMGNRLESLSYIMTSTLCVHFIYIKKRAGRFHFPFDSVNGRASSFIIGKESLSAVEKGIGLFIINAHCCWVVHFFFFFLPVFSLSLENESQVPRNPIYTRATRRKSPSPPTYIDW
jgi:hypothetical protein